MGSKTKKVKSAGRFGTGFGKPKEKLVLVEEKQRKKQKCLFCKGKSKRVFSGVWVCTKCGKKFASHSYFLESFK